MSNVLRILGTPGCCIALLGVLAAVPVAVAQTPPAAAAPPGQAVQTPEAAAERLRPNYILGPGDQILIRAFEVEEISEKPFRIDGDGNLNLPLLGKIHAAGLSVEQLEADLQTRLKAMVRQPQVIVTVTQFRSEPVFFVGAFKAPGIYPLQGRRNLVDMLSAIGGMQPNASRRIKVTRRKEFGAIPLPSAVTSGDGVYTSVEISMGSLRENVNPAEDIVLQPFDVISVDRAEMIYIQGEVGRPGSLEVGERDYLSLIQALSLSGGLTRDADMKKARILRQVMNTSRRAEVPLDISKVMSGRDPDFPLLPNDVLYVPRNSSIKRNVARGLLIAMPLATTFIYVALR